MEIAALVLDYLRVLLSTQIVTALAVIVALSMFRGELRSLLSRIASIRWGPAEVSTPQLPTDATGGPEAAKLPEPTPPALPPGVSVSPQDAQRLQQAMLAERARAHYWEYRYLNYFFAPATQRVLDWLISLPNPVTFTAFDALWQPLIPTAEQRRIIVRVLEEHNLIVFHGELIEVTPKAREYVEWRGALPSPVAEGKK